MDLFKTQELSKFQVVVIILGILGILKFCVIIIHKFNHLSFIIQATFVLASSYLSSSRLIIFLLSEIFWVFLNVNSVRSSLFSSSKGLHKFRKDSA
jgi:hypothetical protein